MTPFRNSLPVLLAAVGGAASGILTEFLMLCRVAGLREAISLPTFIVTELMTCPISASAGRLLNSCPHGLFRMTLPVVLIVCISMSSAVRQTASSASPVSGVKLILVSGVLWLPRKWSR